ncbi:MAG TPA: glycosyltransferase family 2 protein [Nocardioides sp.]|uniref:glycosyltransferase family 2 protein n=1 Tax=Nocardioides sp. TaxID=35761 RepID=UPI002E3347DD|nr:glycosyltransferase family 2 protein [Nocardioides sp.]HEX5088567.1 glycosyltransferase family 2 protein [Nocardioides sp.]
MSAADPRHAPVSVRTREDVSVVLVSHDGERWLPTVLEGLAAQLAPIAHCVAVDTGSKDASADLLDRAFGRDCVVAAPSSTSFPAALRLGLDRLDLLDVRTEWVWVLHDDSTPHPEALLALLAGAADDPEADVLGPLLREWPSLKRLLELGITISRTGRRETGLERGEYDQGQYSEPKHVLAVNTAGMLVRRSVLDELGGLDDELPIFGNDVDFGWRTAAAGHKTVAVPQAVVFHAEAAHRGLRRTPLTGRHTHYQERRAALFTLLANSASRLWPLHALRLLFGTLGRMLGFLVVRSPGEALDDLAAYVSVVAHPRGLLAARRARRQSAAADPDRVKALLAPRWLPYRHALDALSDLTTALTQSATDVADRRRAAAAAADPSSFAARRTAERERLEDEDVVEDTGIVARFLTNPVAVLLALTVLAMLVGARSALGHVSGPGLSPAPEDWRDWWVLHLSSWHELGLGTPVPAPPYVLPLALLSTLLAGSPAAAVSALLVLAVPFAMWGAWRFLRVAGRLATPAGANRWLILWGASAYALVPVVSGGWGEGRIAVVLAAAVLPWLAHAALGFADPEPDRRWRAAWRTGLLLALVSCGTPLAWVVATVVGVVVVVLAFILLPGIGRDRSAWGPPVVALAVVPVLLSPWWLPALLHGAGEGLLLDGGLLPMPVPDGVELGLGRFHDVGAPWWLGAALPVLAALALVPRRTRIPVLICWVVTLLSVLVAVGLGAVTLHLAALSTPPGLGFLLVVVQAALITAVVLGALGVEHPGRAVRGVVVVLAVAAAVVPVAGLAWFVVEGSDLTDDRDAGIPAYMVQSSEQGPEHGILVVEGSVADGLTYAVRRDDGVTTGEDEVLVLSEEDHEFTRLVQELASQPTPEAVDQLASRGIEYVVLPAPADGQVSAALDATAGLEQASAESRSTRAWQVDRPLSADDLDGPRSRLRVGLLVLQGVALLAVLVLCAPTTERGRERGRR